MTSVQQFTKQQEAEILERLSYNPDTGVFTWVKHKYKKKPLSVAGNLDKSGYVRIHICGKKIAAHRLAWFFVHGEWPKEDVDHINEIKNDNRISNLRLATRSQNCMNRGNKKTKGAYFYPNYGNYVAKIMKEGVSTHLGYFDTFEEAKAAYDDAAKELHGEFTNIGR